MSFTGRLKEWVEARAEEVTPPGCSLILHAPNAGEYSRQIVKTDEDDGVYATIVRNSDDAWLGSIRLFLPESLITWYVETSGASYTTFQSDYDSARAEQGLPGADAEIKSLKERYGA